jgi:small subunit ribosomal protein S6
MKTREYEAMFLLDNTAATEDYEGTTGKVDGILEKHGARIAHREKWDERKLAYEIRGHRRATYYLVYFEAPTGALASIREDVALTPVVLRHLAIALDEPISQHIEKRAKERELLAEDSRKSSLTGWGDRKKGREGGRGRSERSRERNHDDDRGSSHDGRSGEGGSGDGDSEGDGSGDGSSSKRGERATASKES